MHVIPILLAFSILHQDAQETAGDRDSDRDGLSDFSEVHKYFTNPKESDSDGDGVPDGDWDERREFSYSVRAVMHVMAPFDVASMNDDYQDVRVLEERSDLLEFEVIVYPFNTVAEAIVPDADWRETPAALKSYVQPGVCSNWDEELRAELSAELEERGIDLDSLDDVETTEHVSKWLMARSEPEDSFTTFAIEFDDGEPRVAAGHEARVDRTLVRRGRSLEEQFDRELFGKGMFANRIHGSCTSSAIYLETGLRAVGLPTRTIVCVPVVDANDSREVAWIASRITHLGMRAHLLTAAERLGGSWASHTFNEVYVGDRGHRLNYTNLGPNVLDDTMGLFIHVHTFSDHSDARLVGWGNRESHPLHDALFGGPNPYSCLSLSDRFGTHSVVPNEPFSGLRELTIRRLSWYDDPERPARLTTSLHPPEDRYFFAHLDTNGVDGHEALLFYRSVDKAFMLRAPDHRDVPAQGIGKFWGDSGDFLLRIEPKDLAHMARGVPYELVWIGASDTLRWQIAEGVRLQR